MERHPVAPEPGPMRAAGAGEVASSVVRLRTAGVATALGVVGLLSLGSAWCGRHEAETPPPLLMETPEGPRGQPPPAPPARP